MKCPGCGADGRSVHVENASKSCTECGYVLAEGDVVSEQTFTEVNGASVASGQWVSYSGRAPGDGGHGLAKKARDVMYEQAKQEMHRTITSLDLPVSLHPLASRFYHLAADQKFTQGRQRKYVIGTCIYIAARRENAPLFIMDIADLMDIGEKRLARTIRDFIRVMGIHVPIVDPTIFLGRYIEMLQLPEKDPMDPGRNPKLLITETAKKLVRSSKREWLQQGRRPAGICGAAIIVACSAHEYRVTVQDVVQMVNVTNGTLKRRLRDLAGGSIQYLSAVELDNMTLDMGSVAPSELVDRSRQVLDESRRPRGRRDRTLSERVALELLADFAPEELEASPSSSQPSSAVPQGDRLKFLVSETERMYSESAELNRLALPGDLEEGEGGGETSTGKRLEQWTREARENPVKDDFFVEGMVYPWEEELDQTYLLDELPEDDIACYINSKEEVAEKKRHWDKHYRERYEMLTEKRRVRTEEQELRRLNSAIQRKRAKSEAPTRPSEAISLAIQQRGSSNRVNYDQLASLLDLDDGASTSTSLPDSHPLQSSDLATLVPGRPDSDDKIPDLPSRYHLPIGSYAIEHI